MIRSGDPTLPVRVANPVLSSIYGLSHRMATVIGQVQEFNSAKKDWPQYVEWLGQFFIANAIVGAKKQVVFLVAMGPTTFKVLWSLIQLSWKRSLTKTW